jgi:hypothetical protein
VEGKMSNNVVNLSLFRNLEEAEKIEFKQWARDNWAVGDPIRTAVWHPVVVEECANILDEHIQANTKKYDSGTLDWNFAYKDMVVALDSSSEEVPTEEQYKMAIEFFWDEEWDRLVGDRGEDNGST